MPTGPQTEHELKSQSKAASKKPPMKESVPVQGNNESAINQQEKPVQTTSNTKPPVDTESGAAEKPTMKRNSTLHGRRLSVPEIFIRR